MATPHRTKQVNLRFPLPLLSQIKTKADAQQQAIADWILAAISREVESASDEIKDSPEAADSFILRPELLEYIKNCLAPLQSEITELRTALGESVA